jgi:hypothetical protein
MVSFRQRFVAQFIVISSLSDVMRSLAFSLMGSSSFGNHPFRIGKQLFSNNLRSGKVRCFSKLDDLMGDVDQLLTDLSSGNSTTTTTSENGAWRSIHCTDLKLRATKPSPVEERMIRNRRVFIKRDDLLRLHGSQVSGNKARKMLAMNEIPSDEFPECLVSYGGPQSNSMLALAAVVNYKNRELLLGDDEDKDPDPAAKLALSKEPSAAVSVDTSTTTPTREKRFVYYTKKLPRFLRNQPSGNLFRALTLGMELVECTHQEYSDLFDSDWGGSPEPPLGLSPPVLGNSMWVRNVKLAVFSTQDACTR